MKRKWLIYSVFAFYFFIFFQAASSYASGEYIEVHFSKGHCLTQGTVFLDGKIQAGGSRVSGAFGTATTPGHHTIEVKSVTCTQGGKVENLQEKSKSVDVKPGKTEKVNFSW